MKEFIGLLKRDPAGGGPSSFKARALSHVPVLAANILMSVLQHDRNWPEAIAKVGMHL